MRAHGGQTRGGAWDEEADTFRLTLYTTITHSGVPARQRTRVQQRRIKQEAARPPAPTRQARGCCAPGGARRSGRCPAVRVPAAAPDEHCRTCRTSCAHLLRSGPLRRSRIARGVSPGTQPSPSCPLLARQPLGRLPALGLVIRGTALFAAHTAHHTPTPSQNVLRGLGTARTGQDHRATPRAHTHPPPHGTPVALGHTRNAHLRIVLWRLGRAVDHPAAHGPAHLRAHTYRHTCTHTRTARAHGSSVNSTASSWCPRVREGWCGRVASCTVRGAPGPHTRIFSSSCCAPPTSSCSGTSSIAALEGTSHEPKKKMRRGVFFGPRQHPPMPELRRRAGR